MDLNNLIILSITLLVVIFIFRKFNLLIDKYNITNEDIKDAIYDYCYNDFESPILKNYIAELDED